MDAAAQPERPPTARQRDVLAFIASCERPPTIREICERFGWSSTMAASTHVRGLIARGLIVSEGVRGLRATRAGHVALGTMDLPPDLRDAAQAILGHLAPLPPDSRVRVLAYVRLLIESV